jgi:uncharacterized protein (UPF0371 family)
MEVVQVIPKLYIRAVSKSKKDAKTFVLCNIDIEAIPELKNVVKNQLTNSIVKEDFDVGVMQGTAVVNICTRDDLEEF